MNTLGKFWEGLAPSDKHLDDRSKWGRFLYQEIIGRIQTPIKSVLDYGCGGGWVDVPFPERTEFHLVDICEENTVHARERLRATGHTGPIETYHYFDANGLPDWPLYKNLKGTIDLLICTVVINHLPNYRMYREVALFFGQLEPRWILLHQRHADHLRECGNIEEYKSHYGTGLLMPTGAFLDPFTDYETAFHALETDAFRFWGTPGYEFVLLKRTE